MARLSTKEIYDINNDDMAHQNASAGTLLSEVPVSGSYTAVADDATAGEMDIDSGLDSITMWNVQVYRAGVNVMEDAIVTATAGVLNIADGAVTYAVTAGDVVKYMIV